MISQFKYKDKGNFNEGNANEDNFNEDNVNKDNVNEESVSKYNPKAQKLTRVEEIIQQFLLVFLLAWPSRSSGQDLFLVANPVSTFSEQIDCWFCQNCAAKRISELSYICLIIE